MPSLAFARYYKSANNCPLRKTLLPGVEAKACANTPTSYVAGLRIGVAAVKQGRLDGANHPAIGSITLCRKRAKPLRDMVDVSRIDY